MLRQTLDGPDGASLSWAVRNHIEAAKEQLHRKPYPFPKLKIIGEVKNIDDFKEENFVLEGYQSHPRIKTDLVIV